MAKAREAAEDEQVPRQVCQLLVDLCRALEKERADRATYTNLASEAMAGESRARAEVERRGKLLAHPLRLAASHLTGRVRERLPTGLADLVTFAERWWEGEIDAH